MIDVEKELAAHRAVFGSPPWRAPWPADRFPPFPPHKVAIDTETQAAADAAYLSTGVVSPHEVVATTLRQAAKMQNFSSAMAFGAGKYQGHVDSGVEWPKFAAEPGAAMVAADLLEEHDYTTGALDTLAKLFPGATAYDLAAMLERPCPGRCHPTIGLNVHDEVVPSPSRCQTIDLSQDATDYAIEREIVTRASGYGSMLRMLRTIAQPGGTEAMRFLAQLGCTDERGPIAVTVGAPPYQRLHAVTEQEGGRHSNPIARAWFVCIERARRVQVEELEKTLSAYSRVIATSTQMPPNILMVPEPTFKALAVKEYPAYDLYEMKIKLAQTKVSTDLITSFAMMMDAGNPSTLKGKALDVLAGGLGVPRIRKPWCTRLRTVLAAMLLRDPA